jgi:hypothetical protein
MRSLGWVLAFLAAAFFARRRGADALARRSVAFFLALLSTEPVFVCLGI